MNEDTLQTVLREKYNIIEKFLVEGRFVVLSDVSRDMADLVAVGISSRCVVVAKVNLSEVRMDYDLVSLTPLSLCRIKIQQHNSFLMTGPINPSRDFILCSCENMEDIWNNFKGVITAVTSKFYQVQEGRETVDLHPSNTFNTNYNQNCLVSGSTYSSHLKQSDDNFTIDGHFVVAGQLKRFTDTSIRDNGEFDDVVFDDFVNDVINPLRKPERLSVTTVCQSERKSIKNNGKSWLKRVCDFFSL